MGVMLTTEDNPHDPRLDFQAWDQWDRANGYNTCAYLDRIAAVADEVPEPVRLSQTQAAMQEIVDMHNGGLYKLLQTDDTE